MSKDSTFTVPPLTYSFSITEPTIISVTNPKIAMNIVVIVQVAHRKRSDFSTLNFSLYRTPSGAKVVGFYCIRLSWYSPPHPPPPPPHIRACLVRKVACTVDYANICAWH